METQTAKRTVRPDVEAINRLRVGKGWRVEDLATKAICSVKTIENVERGASVYVSTLAKIAKALGVEFMALVQGGKPRPEPPKPVSADAQLQQPPKKPMRFKVQITVDIPFEDFDESEQLVDFITRLRRIVRAKDEIVFTDLEPGSTIITLEMSMKDIQDMYRAFTGDQHEAELNALRITQLKMPDGEDFDVTITAPWLERRAVRMVALRGLVHKRPLPISKPAPVHTDPKK